MTDLPKWKPPITWEGLIHCATCPATAPVTLCGLTCVQLRDGLPEDWMYVNSGHICPKCAAPILEADERRWRAQMTGVASGEPPAGPSSTSNHSQEGRE